MKLKVTQPRCNRMEVGAVFEVEGDTIPAWAVGKVEVIGESKELTEDDGDGDKVLVTNPAKPAQPPSAVAKEAAPAAPATSGAQAAPAAKPAQASEAGK